MLDVLFIKGSFDMALWALVLSSVVLGYLIGMQKTCACKACKKKK